MFRVVENLSVTQSLKVIRIYIIEYGVCKFLFVFHCNYGHIKFKLD